MVQFSPQKLGTHWAQLRLEDNNTVDIKDDQIQCYTERKISDNSKNFVTDVIFSRSVSKEKNSLLTEMQFVIKREEQGVEEENRKPAVIECHRCFLYVNGDKLVKGQSRILVHRDIIELKSLEKKFTFMDWRTGFSNKVLSSFYIEKVICKGGISGSVFLAHDVRSMEKFAIKSISLWEDVMVDENPKSVRNISFAKNEIDIMRQLDHPNIVRLASTIWDFNYAHLIIEYMDSGDLLDFTLNSPQFHLTESEARFAMYQICQGLKYLHDREIGHGDIKLDNIFVKKGAENNIYKIGDFGMSVLDREVVKCNGTLNYAAPEVLMNESSVIFVRKSDMWALGVAIYVCFSGSYPFCGKKNEIRQKILSADFNFVARIWREVSNPAKDLISKLLVIDPDKRLNIDQVLEHQWFLNEELTTRLDQIEGELETEPSNVQSQGSESSQDEEQEKEDEEKEDEEEVAEQSPLKEISIVDAEAYLYEYLDEYEELAAPKNYLENAETSENCQTNLKEIKKNVSSSEIASGNTFIYNNSDQTGFNQGVFDISFETIVSEEKQQHGQKVQQVVISQKVRKRKLFNKDDFESQQKENRDDNVEVLKKSKLNRSMKQVNNASESPVADMKPRQKETKKRREPIACFKPAKAPVEGGTLVEPQLAPKYIVCTNMTIALKQSLSDGILMLGGVIETEVTSKTTHVVSPNELRTLNILRGTVKACKIVNVDWIHHSVAQGKWLDTSSYTHSISNKVQDQSILGLQNYKNTTFAQSSFFILTENVGNEKKIAYLNEIIESCSGKFAEQMEVADIIISDRPIQSNKTVVISSFVFDSAMRGIFSDTDKYKPKLLPRQANTRTYS